MSMIEKFLQTSGGSWIRAVNVNVGDKMRIDGDIVLDDQSFDRAYLVCAVTLLRTGEQYKLRLGPKNVGRIAETLGKDEKAWHGKYLEVVSIETYEGFGQKGMLLRGLLTSGQKAEKQVNLGPLTTEAMETVKKSADIISLGLPLTEDDFTILPASIRAELLKTGYVEKRGENYFFTVKAYELLYKSL